MVSDDKQFAIEAFSLAKVFPDWWGRAKVIAVDDLELRVRYNEIYGLLGPNGSGKTTTLKVLLGLLHPTRGRAMVLGGAGSDPKISARIGYLPEESYLYKYLSARETLDFYGRIFSLPSSIRKARIDALLEMVGLTGMANRPVGTYSKGMARRIGLAQAMINDPDLLILDEPTSGMDPIGTRQMKDLLVELASRGKTILLCSHLLADVEDVCDRIGILYGGKMQVEGSVDSLLKHKDEKQIHTGPISASALERIEQIVRDENCKYQVRSPMDRLEEFFIKTVASAERENLPTSGAVSATGQSDFLIGKEATSDILDKLVTAKPAHQPSASEVAETQETQKPAEVPGQEQNDDLLTKLTKPSTELPKTDTVTTTKPAKRNDSSDEQTRQSVLDDLMKPDKNADTDNNPAGGSVGGNNDA